MAVTYGITTPIMSSVMPNPTTVPVMSTVMPNPTVMPTISTSPLSNVTYNSNTLNQSTPESFNDASVLNVQTIRLNKPVISINELNDYTDSSTSVLEIANNLIQNKLNVGVNSQINDIYQDDIKTGLNQINTDDLIKTNQIQNNVNEYDLTKSNIDQIITKTSNNRIEMAEKDSVQIVNTFRSIDTLQNQVVDSYTQTQPLSVNSFGSLVKVSTANNKSFIASSTLPTNTYYGR